jgi:hypothetical protein
LLSVMHRKQIRRWHKLLAASASVIAILGGVFMAPASANNAPSVDMFWADVSRTNQSTVTFYLMTSSSIKNLEASDFYVFGTAIGCTVDDDFSQASFHVVNVRGCSEGTVALQLGANSISDLNLNWGPAQGIASDFTTIDRTSPVFSFDQTLSSSTEPSFNLTASVSEQVQLVDALLSPTLSGNGCSLSGVSVTPVNYVFAITSCFAGADAQLTIYANSYRDAAGNLGPTQNVVSQVVKVQSAVLPLPTPTSSPSPTPTPTAVASPLPLASPTPTASPTPEVAVAAPAVTLPPIEPPQPPASEPPELSPDAEAVVPMAPIASIRAVESAASFEIVAPPVPRRASSVGQTQPVQPEALTNPVPAPKTEFVARANSSAANLSWVMPAASVVSAAFGAVAGALIVRSRLSRKQRVRVA